MKYKLVQYGHQKLRVHHALLVNNHRHQHIHNVKIVQLENIHLMANHAQPAQKEMNQHLPLQQPNVMHVLKGSIKMVGLYSFIVIKLLLLLSIIIIIIIIILINKYYLSFFDFFYHDRIPLGSMNACDDCVAGKQDNADQSECDSCTSGRVAPNSGAASCTPCQAGTAATNKAQACSVCGAGKYSYNFADLCTPCEAGKFQDSSSSSSCKVCVGKDKYTNGTYDASNNPYTSCKTCPNGKLATSNHDACVACPAGEYIPVGGSCTACLPCSEGSERIGCGDPSSNPKNGDCSFCSKGRYKEKGITGGSYTDECIDCQACPLGKERASDEDPCVRNAGGSTSDVSTCTTCNAGFYQSTAVSTRNSFYPVNAYLDKCDECKVCLPGGDRTGCSGSSSGYCSPWNTPTITSVSGSGKDGGSTTGSQPLIIEGYHFGGNLAGKCPF
jgi:hypothetical protein